MSAIQILFVIGSLFLMSCASAPQKGEHVLHSVLLYNLHFRRPVSVGAKPSAYWDDDEYYSQSRPNASWDCEALQTLFKEMNLEAVRGCLRSLKESEEKKTITYVLRRLTMPVLELEDSELAPACIKNLMSQLPVPREIFFQSKEEGKLGCYSARISLVSEEFLKIKSTLHRLKLRITFPLDSTPESDEETLFLLGTWALSPFFKEEGNAIISKIVPNEICRKCIGDKNLFSETDILPPSWPQ